MPVDSVPFTATAHLMVTQEIGHHLANRASGPLLDHLEAQPILEA